MGYLVRLSKLCPAKILVSSALNEKLQPWMGVEDGLGDSWALAGVTPELLSKHATRGLSVAYLQSEHMARDKNQQRSEGNISRLVVCFFAMRAAAPHGFYWLLLASLPIS